jgi:hypothetical protein
LIAPDETLAYSEEELRIGVLDLAEEARIRAEAVTPEPVPVKLDPPKVATEVVERLVPWDFRLMKWFYSAFSLGGHDGRSDSSGRPLWMPRRALLWCFRNWPRFRMMLWVIRSGECTERVTDERWNVCNDCEYLKIGRKAVAYCGSCGCVDWRKSRLLVKNRCAANHCPQRRHKGEYIELVMARYPNRKKPDATKQPQARAGGCGGQHG